MRLLPFALLLLAVPSAAQSPPRCDTPQYRQLDFAPGPNEAPAQQRLTFFHNADGTVRQLWESSSDGKQWRTVFDGLYERKSR